MLIIPAIDIKGGRCVRLLQGRMDAETIYSDEPLDVARKWEKLGAEVIHIVDLDGAIHGTPKNSGLVGDMLKSIGIALQVGGGIRDMKSAECYLEDAGVMRIIVGTAAYRDPALLKNLCRRYPERIAVGIDALDGKAAIGGWVDVTGKDALELAKEVAGSGASHIVYTDIRCDGMLTGPNLVAMEQMVNSLELPVIASGGVATIEDVKMLNKTGVAGVIIGKALYAGKIALADAIAAGKG